MFRILNNCTLKDKISTKSIACELKMLSVNQINAQVKLTETWKALNLEKYPHIVSQKVNDYGHMISRSSKKGDVIVNGKTELRQSSFKNDAAKNWNHAPECIKLCKSLHSAKNNSTTTTTKFIHFFDKTRKIFSAKLSDNDNLRVLKNPSNFFQKVTFKTIQKNKRIVD